MCLFQFLFVSLVAGFCFLGSGGGRGGGRAENKVNEFETMVQLLL